jgi:hypothetical protein
MSILPEQVLRELSELLQALQSSDNNVRSQAEEVLTTNWTNPRPEVLLMGLVEQIHTSQDVTVCALTTSITRQVQKLTPL